MKIEIDIDIESIVKAALKKQQSEDIIPTETTTTNNRSKWEYGRKNNRRRTLEEMALHKLEQEKGRRLTPEEKGEAKAKVQMDETTENTVKEATIKKARINEIAAEGMAAASKELAEEKLEPKAPESDNGKEPEATIPQVEDIGNLNSLFGKDG